MKTHWHRIVTPEVVIDRGIPEETKQVTIKSLDSCPAEVILASVCTGRSPIKLRATGSGDVLWKDTATSRTYIAAFGPVGAELKHLQGDRQGIRDVVAVGKENGATTWSLSHCFADRTRITSTVFTERLSPGEKSVAADKWEGEIPLGHRVFDTRLGDGDLTVGYDWSGKLPTTTKLTKMLAESHGAHSGPVPRVAHISLAAGVGGLGLGIAKLPRRERAVAAKTP